MADIYIYYNIHLYIWGLSFIPVDKTGQRQPLPGYFRALFRDLLLARVFLPGFCGVRLFGAFLVACG